MSCGRCEFCVTGRRQLCERRLLLGASLPGSNAEYVNVPAVQVLALPEGMDLRDAAMTEPAACAVHAVELSGAGPGASALVVGAGPIGLFLLQVLGLHGVAQRYVSDRNPDRLAMAVAMGCTAVPADEQQAAEAVRQATGRRGVDLAFDAVGSAQTRRTCLASTVSGGQVLAVGLHTDLTELPVNTVVRSELSIRGVFAYPVSSFRTALRWLAGQRDRPARRRRGDAAARRRPLVPAADRRRRRRQGAADPGPRRGQRGGDRPMTAGGTATWY